MKNLELKPGALLKKDTMAEALVLKIENDNVFYLTDEDNHLKSFPLSVAQTCDIVGHVPMDELICYMMQAADYQDRQYGAFGA